MISKDTVTIDGEYAWYMPKYAWHMPPDFATQLVYEEINRPCYTCNGDGYGEDSGGMGGRETCTACDGTSRHTFELEVERVCDWTCQCPAGSRSLRVHVVQVLPIVEVDGQPDEVACVDLLGNVWAPGVTREFDPCHVLGDHATLPPAAAPGLYAVKLAVHS